MVLQLNLLRSFKQFAIWQLGYKFVQILTWKSRIAVFYSCILSRLGLRKSPLQLFISGLSFSNVKACFELSKKNQNRRSLNCKVLLELFGFVKELYESTSHTWFVMVNCLFFRKTSCTYRNIPFRSWVHVFNASHKVLWSVWMLSSAFWGNWQKRTKTPRVNHSQSSCDMNNTNSTSLNDSAYTGLNRTKIQQSSWKPSKDLKISLYLLYVIVCTVGVSGNIVVCYILGIKRKHKRHFDILLISLAIADLLALMSGSMTMIGDLMGDLDHWYFGAIMCKLLPSISPITLFASSWTLAVISYDRFRYVL